MSSSLISVAQARDVVGHALYRLPPEGVSLEQAAGRVLSAAIVADLDMPPFDKACMDGFAVRSADVGPGTEALHVVETIAAGSTPTRRIEQSEAARIMTGAPMPEGADAIVMIERSQTSGASVQLDDDPAPGQHVQPRAALFAQGDELLSAGHLIRAPELAMMATVGAAQATVYRQPRVAMVSTGDELVDVSDVPGPGQIRDSNSHALRGLVEAHGGQWCGSRRAGDTAAALQDALSAALDDCDVLLISGGVSAGDYDLVEPALQALGIELRFTGVVLKPGKPAVFGVRLDAQGQVDRLIYGLPGNPISGLVVFLLFGVPALRYLGGRPIDQLDLPRVQARVSEDTPGKTIGRELYLPARVSPGQQGLDVCSVGWQGSSDMLSLTRANAFIVTPAGQAPPIAGDLTEVLLWRDPLE